MRRSGPEDEDHLRDTGERFAARLRVLLSVGGAGNAYFQYRLLEETERCKRHNHYCAVLVIRSTATDADDIHRRVASLTRVTDVVGLVQMRSEPGAASRAVGAILPETAQPGCNALVGRLRDSVLNIMDVSFGSAVFPDDSTDPRSLLGIAGERAA